MKSFFLLLVLMGCSWFGRGQPFPPPPGTVLIGENRFVDKHLINYEAYNEYLYWLINQKQDSLYRMAIPSDTLVSFKGRNVWSHPKMRQCPVLGLTREQALAYCAWRTDVVNLSKSDKKYRCNDTWSLMDKLDPENKLRIVYTLPTASDLLRHQAGKERYQMSEYTSEGVFDRPKTRHFHDTGMQVFRCAAYYEPRQ